MGVNAFISFALKSTDPAGTDETLYSSEEGGYRDSRFWPPRLRAGRMNARVDDSGAPVPATLSCVLDNSDRYFDQYLPGGSSEQIWRGGTVKMHIGGQDGDTFTETVFLGQIVGGSVRTQDGQVSFTASQMLAEQDPIADEYLASHPQYDSSSAADGVGVTRTPVIIGDWVGSYTSGTPTYALPAYLVKKSGTVYTYAFCNHECTGVLVFRNGTNITTTGSTNPAAGDGFLTLDTTDFPGWDDGDTITVKCVGYGSTITDSNPARVIEAVLTTASTLSSSAGSIYNAVDQVDNNDRAGGSFEHMYNMLGGSSPDYGIRAYVDSDISAIALATDMARWAGLFLSIQEAQFRLHWQYTDASVSTPTSFREARIERGSVTTATDPDNVYANAARIRYRLDPSSSTYQSTYDTTQSITSGPIYDANQAYGSNVLWQEDCPYLWDTDTVVAVQRILLWRSRQIDVVSATLLDDDPEGTGWSLILGNDIALGNAAAADPVSTPTFVDDFAGSLGTAVTSSTPEADWVGGGWQTLEGSMELDGSGNAYHQGGQRSRSNYADFGQADMLLQANGVSDVGGSGRAMQLLVRHISTSQTYWFQISATALRIYRVNTTFTLLASSTPGGYGGAHLFKFQAKGTGAGNLQAWMDSDTLSATDNVISGDNVGLRIQADGSFNTTSTYGDIDVSAP